MDATLPASIVVVPEYPPILGFVAHPVQNASDVPFTYDSYQGRGQPLETLQDL